MHFYTLNFVVITVYLVMSSWSTSLAQSSVANDSNVNSDDIYDWAGPVEVQNSEEYLASHDNWEFVSIGKDTDGLLQFVGRILYEKELLPGKVKITKNYLQRLFGFNTKKIYFTYDGEEHEELHFEGLYVSPRYEAVIKRVNGGDIHVPPKAVVGGKSRNGETLYIGEINIPGVGPSPGKIVMSEGKIYGTWGGREYVDRITNFLVIEKIE